ncbi:hypothetical protein HanPSC8_Chr10g0420471 [Helianthus annuus]|nr:hypothetical protein HanPSC8_Chr10g0420471 [Helianthus annuus]
MPPGSSQSFVRPSDSRPFGPRMKKPSASKSTPKSSQKIHLKVAFGPRPPRPVTSRPMAPTSAPKPTGTSVSGEETSFQEFVRDKKNWMSLRRKKQNKISKSRGEHTPLQVQARCKLDELKKIQDDLDKDKDPNTAQWREQPSSSQATETTTEAAVEGDCGSDAGGGRGKGQVKDKDDEAVGVLKDLRLDEDINHVMMSKGAMCHTQ